MLFDCKGIWFKEISYPLNTNDRLFSLSDMNLSISSKMAGAFFDPVLRFYGELLLFLP